ncbi:hypothetical protein KM043_005519 [Ampulex compressa]|nr:hypothetical protein KM043_005519 [Ampulex compressa]
MDMTMGDTRNRGTRWVCPNDRHLALRAKLRTGWSVKTGSLDSRWSNYTNSYLGNPNHCNQSFVLTEEERQSIIQVIQRAEALDLSEQERVGKLVERLENMKRNVCIVTSTRLNEKRNCGRRCSGGARCVCSCALCGEKFGAVLGASPSLCKDCRKYTCQKCGIEATAPNPAFGSVPSTTRAASSTNVPAQEPTAVHRIVKRSTGNAQKQFLCRICAETREMWKKSGAWFFKGMPKYVLPEKKERGWSRGPQRTSTWTIGAACKSLDSVDPQDSSSDDDATRRFAVARDRSTSSVNLQGNRDSSTFKTVASGQGASGKTLRRGRSNGSSPVAQRDELSDRLDKSCLSIASQCSRLSPSGSTTTLRSRRSPNGLHPEQRVSFEDEAEREERSIERENDVEGEEEHRRIDGISLDRSKSSQVHSIRLTSPTSPMTTTTTVMDRNQEQARSNERNVDQEGSRSFSDRESFSSGTRTGSQIDSPRLQTSEYPQEMVQDYGTLEVSLRYDPAAQCLQCKVERARGLRPMDIHGLADPFCKLNILPIGKVATPRRLRTKTVHKTRDPEFNETVNFYGTTETDVSNGKALHVLILQDDPAGQDFLGEAKFPLDELQPYQTKHCSVSLQDRYPVDSEEITWGVYSTGRGQIQISLSYCTRRRALTVTVHRAINLLPMDSNGFSDPFVKMCLLEDTMNNQRQQRSAAKRLVIKKITGRNYQSTSIKWKTLNPEWNEEFVFVTRLTDLMRLTLCLSVWDKDFGKSNDYLGGLALSCNSKGARLRHWIDAIKFPDHRHRAWHNLTETMVSTD